MNIFIILWLAVASMFALIGIGVVWWYENENLSKKEIIKKHTLKTIYFVIFMGVSYLYKNYIPFYKNHGIEFNNERQKLGIAKIGKNWKNKMKQFESYWENKEPKSNHTEKIITYGILGVKSETDYYNCNGKEGKFIWSIYNFKNNTFKYFVRRLDDSNQEINKTKFEKYKAEYNEN